MAEETTRVKLSSADRVLFPEDGVTKGDLFEYYDRVADGIHVVAPITRRSTYQQTYDFAERASRLLETRHPGLVTTEWLKRKRAGVLADHRQNGWGKTIASVYSVRPKPGAPVSTPLRWDELRPGLKPRDFTMDVVLERVRGHGDLFAPVLERLS